MSKRRAVFTYTENLEAEIDEAAECDRNEFWKLINRKQKSRRCDHVSEMVFHGVKVSNPNDINIQWRKYIAKVYTSVTGSFDNTHLQGVDSEVL